MVKKGYKSIQVHEEVFRLLSKDKEQLKKMRLAEGQSFDKYLLHLYNMARRFRGQQKLEQFINLEEINNGKERNKRRTKIRRNEDTGFK